MGWKNVRGRERPENLNHSAANSIANCSRPAWAGWWWHLQRISVPLWTRGRWRIAGGLVIVKSRRHCERAIFKAFLCFKCYSIFPTVHEGVQKWAKSAHIMPCLSMHDNWSIIGLKLKSSYWFRCARAWQIQWCHPFWLKPDFWHWNCVSKSKISVFHAVFCLVTAKRYFLSVWWFIKLLKSADWRTVLPSTPWYCEVIRLVWCLPSCLRALMIVGSVAKIDYLMDVWCIKDVFKFSNSNVDSGMISMQ